MVKTNTIFFCLVEWKCNAAAVLSGLILITGGTETAHNIPKMVIAICCERNQSCFDFVLVLFSIAGGH